MGGGGYDDFQGGSSTLYEKKKGGLPTLYRINQGGSSTLYKRMPNVNPRLQEMAF
jgi:hypothetical protein